MKVEYYYTNKKIIFSSAFCEELFIEGNLVVMSVHVVTYFLRKMIELRYSYLIWVRFKGRRMYCRVCTSRDRSVVRIWSLGVLVIFCCIQCRCFFLWSLVNLKHVHQDIIYLRRVLHSSCKYRNRRQCSSWHTNLFLMPFCSKHRKWWAKDVVQRVIWVGENSGNWVESFLRFVIVVANSAVISIRFIHVFWFVLLGDLAS